MRDSETGPGILDRDAEEEDAGCWKDGARGRVRSQAKRVWSGPGQPRARRGGRMRAGEEGGLHTFFSQYHLFDLGFEVRVLF